MVGASMECSPTIEPAYLNLPGWRCVPVYAVPVSPNSRSSPNSLSPPPLEAHNLLPNNIPQDPRQWSRQHVFSWLEWCVESFGLPPLDIDQFYMNGRGLCLLKKSDFCDRSPRSGDILYNALQILIPGREKPKEILPPSPYPNNVSASLLQHATQEKAVGNAFPSRMGSAWPRSISSDFHSVGHVVHESEQARVAVSGLNHLNGSDVDSTTASSPPPPPLDDASPERGCIAAADGIQNNSKLAITTPDIRNLSQFGEIGNSSEKINVRLLWDFLQQLLNDSQQRYQCCIVWKDKGRGIFKITDPHRLAALWGKQKNHLNMNFDKMSRALRYYYRVRILQKEPGERHCYRFLRHPNELRHCKQRALLSRDSENGVHNGVHSDVEAALDMSIKEEGLSPVEAE